MEYKVVTADAEEDLNQYIRYLLTVKKSDQEAAGSDFSGVISAWLIKLFRQDFSVLFFYPENDNNPYRSGKEYCVYLSFILY